MLITIRSQLICLIIMGCVFHHWNKIKKNLTLQSLISIDPILRTTDFDATGFHEATEANTETKFWSHTIILKQKNLSMTVMTSLHTLIPSLIIMFGLITIFVPFSFTVYLNRSEALEIMLGLFRSIYACHILLIQHSFGTSSSDSKLIRNVNDRTCTWGLDCIKNSNGKQTVPLLWAFNNHHLSLQAF